MHKLKPNGAVCLALISEEHGEIVTFASRHDVHSARRISSRSAMLSLPSPLIVDARSAVYISCTPSPTPPNYSLDTLRLDEGRLLRSAWFYHHLTSHETYRTVEHMLSLVSTFLDVTLKSTRIEGFQNGVYILFFSMATNGNFFRSVKKISGDASVTFYFVKDGLHADIYMKPSLDYSLTKITPLSELGTYKYQQTKSDLPGNAVEIPVS